MGIVRAVCRVVQEMRHSVIVYISLECIQEIACCGCLVLGCIQKVCDLNQFHV